ncbi:MULTISPECIES: hypothetical protein [unclassified Pseudomonas]|jgi:hypothetical protein|uniref:hypothetical protein n=1 Tax=unclassified Pseudomonas TaxID=196821 RepID=UPI001E31CBA6|nr:MULTISPECIES: hypothetical protein [unclassified Pseudomonas]MCE0913982.1 hypothetical protein [Pseudomonas sp. NMI760_13]MCP8634596.1 hypothetical protein [Pseudomonas sp. DVZ6]MDC0686230.1 hypothetical protein [Mitsuaria sp. RG]MDD7785427.1 hypothetical protein [Pseudomonas sp. DVZ24]
MLTARLLQGLGLILVAYLFVCLMTAGLRQTGFSLELPDLVEPDSNSALELLLFAVPGLLLFLLFGCFIRNRRTLIHTYVLLAIMVAQLQCLNFAESYGSTWSGLELVMLLGMNTHWLLLALIPGLALLLGIEQLRRQSA